MNNLTKIIEYYDSKKNIKEFEYYIDDKGLKQGQSITYDEFGIPFIYSNYKDDMLEGEYTVYLTNGEINKKLIFKNNWMIERVK
jgi:antitoxin component YwqK of YwqJK toxin-antitoxin module